MKRSRRVTRKRGNRYQYLTSTARDVDSDDNYDIEPQGSAGTTAARLQATAEHVAKSLGARRNSKRMRPSPEKYPTNCGGIEGREHNTDALREPEYGTHGDGVGASTGVQPLVAGSTPLRVAEGKATVQNAADQDAQDAPGAEHYTSACETVDNARSRDSRGD